MASSEEFKIGSEHDVSLYDLLKPLEGRVVTIYFSERDGKPTNCRVTRVGAQSASVKVIPSNMKE